MDTANTTSRGKNPATLRAALDDDAGDARAAAVGRVGIGKGKARIGKAPMPSKTRSMYGEESSSDEEEAAGERQAQHPHGRYGKMPRKLPSDGEDSDAPAEEDDDRTSNGSASVASKRVFRRRNAGRAASGGPYTGVRKTRMRLIAQRAGLRLCRQPVHEVIEEFLGNFVAGVTYWASAIASGRGMKTLQAEEVSYALAHRNLQVMA